MQAIAEVPEVAQQFTLEAFLSSPGTDAPPFLISGVFPGRSVTLLTAQPGSGKSMIGMAMLLAIARGEPFAGLETRRSPVIYVGEDSARWDYAGIARKFLGDGSCPPEFFARIREGFRLDDSRKRSELRDFAKSIGARGIVLDSLRSVHSKDENKSDEMQEVMEAARDLAESTEAGILLIHHPSKPTSAGHGSEFRGSSVILASCDFHLNLKSTKPKGQPARALSVTFEKGRCAETPDQLQLLMTWGSDWARIEADDTAEFVLEMLLEQGQSNAATMAKALGERRDRSESTARKAVDQALKTLETGDIVWKEGDKKNGYLWSLKPSRN